MTTISFTTGDPIAEFIHNCVEHIDSVRPANQPETHAAIIEKFSTAGFFAADVFIPKFLVENGHVHSRAIHVDVLACACHEANRAYCRSIGDDSQLPWEEAPEWQRASAIQGVRFLLENPDATPEQQHDAWTRNNEDGWKYGPVKDLARKEHPCFPAYDHLPAEQQAKYHIFASILRQEMEREQQCLKQAGFVTTPKDKDLFAPGQADARQTDEPMVSPGAALFRSRYRKLSEGELALHDALKTKAGELAELFYQVAPVHLGHVPDREKGANVQLAIRHLEDAVMRAVKALTS